VPVLPEALVSTKPAARGAFVAISRCRAIRMESAGPLAGPNVDLHESAFGPCRIIEEKRCFGW